MKAHYLPQCYLKGFLDPASHDGKSEPYLWVRDPTAHCWKKKAPKKIARIRNYYALDGSDGSIDNSIEQELSKTLENDVAPILRRLPFSDDLPENDQAAVILFTAVMALRIPAFHDTVESRVIVPIVQSWHQLGKPIRRWNGPPSRPKVSVT